MTDCPRAGKLSIDQLGGNCPVQAEGEIDGHSFYFRARGARWSMEVGGDIDAGKPLWTYSETYGVWPDAGWMPEADAHGFITKAADLFRGSGEAIAAQVERDKSREEQR